MLKKFSEKIEPSNFLTGYTGYTGYKQGIALKSWLFFCTRFEKRTGYRPGTPGTAKPPWETLGALLFLGSAPRSENRTLSLHFGHFRRYADGMHSGPRWGVINHTEKHLPLGCLALDSLRGGN